MSDSAGQSSTKGYTTVKTAPLTTVRGPAAFIPKKKDVPLPRSWFPKVFGVGFVAGICLELFMIKTGFYGTVTKIEGERIQEHRVEYEIYKRQLNNYYEKEVLPIIEAGKKNRGQ